MIKQKKGFKNKVIKLLVIAASLSMLMPLNILAIPQHTDNFFVNDYANVLDNDTEDFIMNKSAALAEKTEAQIVVLTVENMDGQDSNSFAIETARDWGIGDNEKNNGILILVSLEEGEIRVEVGRGLEGALNDGKVGRIIDNEAMPYLSNDDFNKGILSIYQGVLREVMVEYNITSIDDYQPEYVEYDDEGVSLFEIILLIIVIIIIISFMPKGPINKGRSKTYYPPNTFGGGFTGGNFGNSRGGGGFSGGGFRGGGGGFSGGGAGRKF